MRRTRNIESVLLQNKPRKTFHCTRFNEWHKTISNINGLKYEEMFNYDNIILSNFTDVRTLLFK